MDFFKKYGSILILVFTPIFSGVGMWLVNVYQAGTEAKFEDKVVEVFIKKLDDPELMNKLLSNPQVLNFKDKAGETIVNKVERELHKRDSLNNNKFSEIAKKLGIRDKDLNPLLESLLRDYKDKKLMQRERTGINPNFNDF
ncbi:MAG: hypothetical protein KC589_03190 [Nanoarchaeota archaeon]|nr:hypothetical protein [Nanoarchaeota archaeon]